MRTYPLAQAVQAVGWGIFVTDVTELHANGVLWQSPGRLTKPMIYDGPVPAVLHNLEYTGFPLGRRWPRDVFVLARGVMRKGWWRAMPSLHLALRLPMENQKQ